MAGFAVAANPWCSSINLPSVVDYKRAFEYYIFHLFAFHHFDNIPNAPLIKVALVSTFKTDFPTTLRY
jgi:hypothetical protein